MFQRKTLHELKTELAYYVAARLELATEFDQTHDVLAPVWASAADYRLKILATFDHNDHNAIIPLSGQQKERRALFQEWLNSDAACQHCGTHSGLCRAQNNGKCTAAGYRRNLWRNLCARNKHYKQRIKALTRQIAVLEKPHPS